MPVNLILRHLPGFAETTLPASPAAKTEGRMPLELAASALGSDKFLGGASETAPPFMNVSA
jgi:hypothetical protein